LITPDVPFPTFEINLYDTCRICEETGIIEELKCCTGGLCLDCCVKWFSLANLDNIRQFYCPFCNTIPNMEKQFVKKQFINFSKKLPQLNDSFITGCRKCYIVLHTKQHFCTNCVNYQTETKFCPQCSAPSVKISGCSSVTCTVCDTMWCYRCVNINCNCEDEEDEDEYDEEDEDEYEEDEEKDEDDEDEDDEEEEPSTDQVSFENETVEPAIAGTWLHVPANQQMYMVLVMMLGTHARITHMWLRALRWT